MSAWKRTTDGTPHLIERSPPGRRRLADLANAITSSTTTVSTPAPLDLDAADVLPAEPLREVLDPRDAVVPSLLEMSVAPNPRASFISGG